MIHRCYAGKESPFLIIFSVQIGADEAPKHGKYGKNGIHYPNMRG